MSHGLPDNYRGVDIAYQALSEMIIRPKYGGAVDSSGSAAAVANLLKYLVSISGKGMVYGGFLYTNPAASQKNSLPLLIIDGSTLLEWTFEELNDFNIVEPRNYVVNVLKYDDTNFIYSVGFPYGLTFETSLSLVYYEKHGDTPTIRYSMVYALI